MFLTVPIFQKGTFLVPRFYVPIDYKRTNFFTKQEQDVHSGVNEEHFVPSSFIRVEHIVPKLVI